MAMMCISASFVSTPTAPDKDALGPQQQATSLQVEAHHYCSCTNDEVRQCVIYDSADSNARLIGIEYIISRRLFESLPEEERKLWHSHTYEVCPSTTNPCQSTLHCNCYLYLHCGWGRV